jgi:uncharacterized protein DUF6293
MIYPERVHIIPVGDDDIKRIVIPASKGKADRVYLVTMEEKNLFENTVQSAASQLKKKNIEVVVARCNLENFNSFIITVARIIKEEKDKKNIVSYSISSGGNLAAAAGMLACLLFQIQPYFIKKDFSLRIVTQENLQIPLYHIDVPKEPLIVFLSEMNKLMKKGGNQATVSKKQSLEIMKAQHSDEIFTSTSGEYNKLKFRYLDKLLNSRYIEIENKTRGKISITDEGHFALEFFAIYYKI